MSNIIGSNLYNNQIKYAPQHYNDQQNNFGAIDKEQLKKDTAEIAQKTKEQVKENWIFRTLRNTFGIKDPKKFLISLGLTIGTVIGCAYLGNKMSDKTAELGLKIDEKLLGKDGNSLFARARGKLSKIKGSIGTFIKKHSKTANDISETLHKRMAKPKADLTRGYGRGFVSIFSLTPVDILNKAFKGDIKAYQKAAESADKQAIFDKIKTSVSKLVGEDKAASFTEQILGTASEKFENREFCSKLSEAIRENFGCEKSNKEFLKVLKGLKSGNINGVDVSEFTNVKMSGGGIIGSWWPVNILNKVKSLITGKPSNFGRGQLGDSLIKFNAVNGTLADTTLGKLAQKSITVPTESISNFVNDKSGLGVLLCSTIMSTYNNAQDAKKGEKGAVVADNFVGTIGSIAISTPLAFKTTYGLASLQNLEGKSILSKMLKPIGKVFGMGLDKIDPKTGEKILNTSKIKGFAGGAFRFAMIMFVFSSLFSKPINAAIHKVFGKPSEPNNNVNNTNTPVTNVPVQTNNIAQPNNRDTNLINKWTQLPASSETKIEKPIQEAPNAAAPIYNNQQAEQQQENEQIAAFNLFKKDKQSDRYIPTIEQPALNVAELNEAETQKQVNDILKRTDSVIKETRKYL